MRGVTATHSQKKRQAPLTRNEVFFSFSGRITRRTFWRANLVALGISILLYAIFIALTAIGFLPDFVTVSGILLVGVTCYFSLYAIAAKRWHDRNMSGWWSLVSFVPLFNFLMLIPLGFFKGTDGPNSFGPPP